MSRSKVCSTFCQAEIFIKDYNFEEKTDKHKIFLFFSHILSKIKKRDVYE